MGWHLSQSPEDLTIPLVCTLDGALLKTNFRSERFIQQTRRVLDALLSSKFDLIRLQLEKSDQPATGSALPIDEQVYDFLLTQKNLGRQLVLICQSPVDQVTEMLGEKNIFDQILHADEVQNPNTQDPSTKDLKARLGSEYNLIGSEATPIAWWKDANDRYVAEKSAKASGLLTKTNLPVAGKFERSGASLKAIYKSIRAYQWLKNLLVFVPLITSQQFTNMSAVTNSIIMFFCFSMVASFGYIVNDILDLQSDRAHPTKRERPFASGKLSIQQGALLGIILLALAVVGCLFLPLNAGIALAAYLFLTITYSLYLKTKVMIDIVALGGLFTLRVIGGGAAIETELSFYLLCFSIFIFSSLGLVKRFAELNNLQIRKKLTARGRGYRVEDMIPVLIIGITLGYLSVFVMGLYINSPVVTEYYSNTKFIWFLLPLLTYWLGRLWILTHRGEMNEDPLIFAIKDRTSLLVLIVAGGILVVAK